MHALGVCNTTTLSYKYKCNHEKHRLLKCELHRLVSGRSHVMTQMISAPTDIETVQSPSFVPFWQESFSVLSL